MMYQNLCSVRLPIVAMVRVIVAVAMILMYNININGNLQKEFLLSSLHALVIVQHYLG